MIILEEVQVGLETDSIWVTLGEMIEVAIDKIRLKSEYQ